MNTREALEALIRATAPSATDCPACGPLSVCGEHRPNCAREAARTALSADDWTPIEQIPDEWKDGRWVLVCGGKWCSDEAGCGWGDDGRPLEQPRTARWHKDDWWLGYGDMYNEELWCEPTHARLIEPPKGETDGRNQNPRS